MKYHSKVEAGFESLAACVVRQAYSDYKKALRRKDPSSIHAMQRFFKGEWCKLLCTVDGEVLMELAEKEVERERKQRHGQRKPSKPLSGQD